MRLSVIVPTCNERDELAACLDALAAHTPDIETIVVNGPSTDGTSGMVRSRSDVDVLLDCSSRNINVARNVGLLEATGDAFALLAPAYRIQSGWFEAIMDSLSGNADLVTGPVKIGPEENQHITSSAEDETHVVGGNVALSKQAVTALDGFDEYLTTGGARDLAQRTEGQDMHVIWHPQMAVRADRPIRQHRRQHRGGYEISWQGAEQTDWGGVYRSLAYRSIKNTGLGIRVIGRMLLSAIRDGVTSAREIVGGDGSPSRWAANGVSIGRNVIRGVIDGYRARRSDRTPAHNPHGLSQSAESVVVNRYDD